MRVRTYLYGLIALVVSVLAVGCATRAIPHVPQPPVAVADAEVRQYVAKTIAVLDSLGDVTADLSREERKLFDAGMVPDPWHRQFRMGITALATKGLQALDQIERGVTAWPQLKGLLDPIVADINRLIDQVNALTSGSLKSRLTGILNTLASGFAAALSGGAR